MLTDCEEMPETHCYGHPGEGEGVRVSSILCFNVVCIALLTVGICTTVSLRVSKR